MPRDRAGGKTPRPTGPRCTSERQIVVFGVERLGEVVEPFLALGSCRTGGNFGRRESLRPVSPTGEQDQLPSIDLGGVSGLTFPILPGAVLDAALDVDF